VEIAWPPTCPCLGKGLSTETTRSISHIRVLCEETATTGSPVRYALIPRLPVLNIVVKRLLYLPQPFPEECTEELGVCDDYYPVYAGNGVECEGKCDASECCDRLDCPVGV